MDVELNNGALLLKEKGSRIPTVVGYILLFIFAAFCFFYIFFGLTYVDGESMENTIYDEQHVFILKHGYNIERGDIFTFNVGSKSEPHELIKRIIAVSGDRLVYVRDKSNTFIDLYICKSGENSFKLLDEPYIKERMLYSKFTSFVLVRTVPYIEQQVIEGIDLSIEYPDDTEDIRQSLLVGTISVPNNHFYFLGDNRNNSSDSRYYGTRDKSCILGKMIAILQSGSKADKLLDFLF